MKLLFIRHGQTETNTRGVMHRSNDEDGLSTLGKQQAEKLVEICKNHLVEILYSSPEKRALETATIISNAMNVPMKTLPNLRERNWGDWEGKPWDEVKKILDPMTLDERYKFVPPNGESWQQMEHRLKEILDYVTSQKVKSIAVVTHGGALRGLMPLLTNAPKESSFKYDFKNASVSFFNYEDGNFGQLTVNDISHL